MTTVRELLGGRDPRDLAPVQRLAIAEVLELYGGDAPEFKQVLARILRDPSLAATAEDWERAKRSRERYEAAAAYVDCVFRQ